MLPISSRIGAPVLADRVPPRMVRASVLWWQAQVAVIPGLTRWVEIRQGFRLLLLNRCFRRWCWCSSGFHHHIQNQANANDSEGEHHQQCKQGLILRESCGSADLAFAGLQRTQYGLFVAASIAAQSRSIKLL